MHQKHRAQAEPSWVIRGHSVQSYQCIHIDLGLCKIMHFLTHEPRSYILNDYKPLLTS